LKINYFNNKNKGLTMKKLFLLAAAAFLLGGAVIAQQVEKGEKGEKSEKCEKKDKHCKKGDDECCKKGGKSHGKKDKDATPAPAAAKTEQAPAKK